MVRCCKFHLYLIKVIVYHDLYKVLVIVLFYKNINIVMDSCLVCEDTDRFTEVITDGIQFQEAWEKEQEQLMKTVKGQLMKHPSAVFEIKTPDGDIRISPNDIKLLLSGEMNTVVIDGCHYAAFELLDQEVVGMQTDIFDDSLIRMKTGGYEEPDFEMTM